MTSCEKEKLTNKRRDDKRVTDFFMAFTDIDQLDGLKIGENFLEQKLITDFLRTCVSFNMENPLNESKLMPTNAGRLNLLFMFLKIYR
jgi:hypothetical protein